MTDFDDANDPGHAYKKIKLLRPSGFDEDVGPATEFLDRLESDDTLHIVLRTQWPSWQIYVKQANVTIQLQVYGARDVKEE